MSPATRRRPTGRVRRQPTVARKDGTPRGTFTQELGSLLSDAKTAVTSRTTKTRCPHCAGMPWVNARDWPAHKAMHRMAGPKGKARNDQRMEHVRARGDRDWWKRRPRSTQANPGGDTFDPTWMTNSPDDPLPWEQGKGKPTRPGSPHTGQRPPTVRIVPDDPPDTKLPWSSQSAAVKSGWMVGVGALLTEWAQRRWELFMAPFRMKPTRAKSTDGKRWKERTHNPGGGPVSMNPPLIDTTTPDPGPTNVTPIRLPGGNGPVSTGPAGGGSGGGTKAPPKPAKRPPKGGGGGTPGGGGGGGGDGFAEGANRWARQLPETLVAARQDAQTGSEGLAGIADALLLRMNMETDRSISAQCVEPYQEAAQQVRAAADKLQEVHQRLLQRYGPTAEELAKPDTPDPEYLKEGT